MFRGHFILAYNISYPSFDNDTPEKLGLLATKICSVHSAKDQRYLLCKCFYHFYCKITIFKLFLKLYNRQLFVQSKLASVGSWNRCLTIF